MLVIVCNSFFVIFLCEFFFVSFSGDWVYVKKTSVWFQVYMIFAGFILQKVVFWVPVRKVMQKTRVID